MNKDLTPAIQFEPAMGFSTSQEEAQLFMESHNLSHFPLVDHGIYLGNLLAEDIFALESGQTLEVLRHNLEIFAIDEEANWFDILEQCSKHDANMVPIINSKKEYLGYYLFKDLLESFTETPFFAEKALTLTLQKQSQKYSFSEISHIVESNNSTLLGLFLSKIEKDMTEIILKINSDNINEVLQAFRRHDYEIISKHLEDDYTNELLERSNYLNKYLNI